VAAAYDMDGQRQWIRLIETPNHSWGHSASPLLINDMVLIQLNQLHAIDIATGQTRWNASIRPRWGSSIHLKIGDVDTAITPNGEVINAVDGKILATGLGSLEYNTPVHIDGIIYFIEHRATAVRVPAAAAGPYEKVWTQTIHNDRYYASPLIHRGLIYAITRKATFTVLHADTGNIAYSRQLDLGRGEFYPSPIATRDHVVMSIDNGAMLSLKPGAEYVPVSTNRLNAFKSSPIIVNDRLIVRTEDALICIGTSVEQTALSR